MPTRALPTMAVLVFLLSACGSQPSAPGQRPGTGPGNSSSSVEEPAVPDPARVYADMLGRTEDLPRVLKAPKEYEGKSIVLYGLRNGDLRPIEGRYSMPLAATDGKTVISATERPGNNQFYLLVTEEFAREARDRKMLVSGIRGPVFVECKVSAQTVGRVTTYPCEIASLVLITGDRVSDTLWRGKGQAFEYHHY
jgi:hypothetical protein